MKGLYGKYIIKKSNKEPIDPNADYFVLRLDTDEHARKALKTYADSIKNENPALAGDIHRHLDKYNPKMKDIARKLCEINNIKHCICSCGFSENYHECEKRWR